MREIIRQYKALKRLADALGTEQFVSVADECDIAAGFICSGGIYTVSEGVDSSRRLQRETERLLSHVDDSGAPLTPVSTLRAARMLQSDLCPQSFNADCDVKTCSGCQNGFETQQRNRCLSARAACLANSETYLTLPFLEDLRDVVNMLEGGDVEVMRFTPPTQTFSLGFEWAVILYGGKQE